MHDSHTTANPETTQITIDDTTQKPAVHPVFTSLTFQPTIASSNLQASHWNKDSHILPITKTTQVYYTSTQPQTTDDQHPTAKVVGKEDRWPYFHEDDHLVVTSNKPVDKNNQVTASTLMIAGLGANDDTLAQEVLDYVQNIISQVQLSRNNAKKKAKPTLAQPNVSTPDDINNEEINVKLDERVFVPVDETGEGIGNHGIHHDDNTIPVDGYHDNEVLQSDNYHGSNAREYSSDDGAEEFILPWNSIFSSPAAMMSETNSHSSSTGSILISIKVFAL